MGIDMSEYFERSESTAGLVPHGLRLSKKYLFHCHLVQLQKLAVFVDLVLVVELMTNSQTFSSWCKEV